MKGANASKPSFILYEMLCNFYEEKDKLENVRKFTY